MNADRTEWWYTPPSGPLYDFDDSLVDGRDRTQTRRWLVGFNGRVLEPADNVQLGWRSASGALVTVGTFHPSPDADRESHRLTAAWMLDGVQFYAPGPPATRTLTGADHLRQVSRDNALWSKGNLRVDASQAPSFSATVSGGTLVHTDGGSVVVVSRGIPLDRLRVRTLPKPAEGYPVDPRQPQTTTALDSEWDAFFEDRPDLFRAGHEL